MEIFSYKLIEMVIWKKFSDKKSTETRLQNFKKKKTNNYM